MRVKSAKSNPSKTQKLIDNLRALLKIHKITGKKLGQILNIDQQTISRIVTGGITDPKLSTLKSFANYFNVTLDTLIEGNCKTATAALSEKKKPILAPLLDWQILEKVNSIKEIDLSQWSAWEATSIEKQINSEQVFAIESRPSMYPRYPLGTIFIIAEDETPQDGEIVLVRIKKNKELTLRELAIDAPQWKLKPLVPGSEILQYTQAQYKIVGVVLLTLIHHRKIYE